MQNLKAREALESGLAAVITELVAVVSEYLTPEQMQAVRVEFRRRAVVQGWRISEPSGLCACHAPGRPGPRQARGPDPRHSPSDRPAAD